MAKPLIGKSPVKPRSFQQHLERIHFQLRRPFRFRSLVNRSAKYKCIFVHIPKSAGSSVRESLFDSPTGAHRTLSGYQTVLSPKLFAECFKFTFVRNPWDRLLSAFLFLKNKDMSSNHKWARENLSQFDDFNTFVTKWVTPNNVRSYVFFHPQYQFLCLEGKQLGVDFIGFYENLQPDFQAVCKRINSSATLQEKNRNWLRDKDYRGIYTAETREIVAEVYADDLELFGYNFDNSSLPEQIVARDKAFLAAAG